MLGGIVVLLVTKLGWGSNVCDVRSQKWKAMGDNATDDTRAIQTVRRRASCIVAVALPVALETSPFVSLPHL